MKIVIDIVLMMFGFISYERGWAKRAARRPVYEYLTNQFQAASSVFETAPNTQNRLARDRCELNLIYESQRGRPLRRIGVFLIVIGGLLLYIYR